jgi:hypothetical protein
MSVPELPDAFGNYAIKGIREVLPPDAISWMPATAGWKAVGVLALALACWFVVKRWRRWRANRYRREALAALSALAAAPPDEQLEAIAVLLKTSALNAWPRGEVAALSGQGWVAWLESADARLSPASRELLSTAQYRGTQAVDAAAVHNLAEEAAQWIRRHRGPAP